MELSSEYAKELIEDRIKFKLYTAEYHLRNLKFLEQNEGDISSSFQSRVQWEMEIESLLSQLIGAKDALLVLINDRLRLGIELKDVNLGAINKKLKFVNKGALLENLNKLTCQPESLFWILNDLRNQSMHRGLISIKVSHHLYEDVNTNVDRRDSSKVYLTTHCQSNLEVIPYFEDSIQKMSDLIKDIRNKEPGLN